jgi:hypothetical protein
MPNFVTLDGSSSRATKTESSISIFLLAVGLISAAVISLIFFSMGKFPGAEQLWVFIVFIGPLLLITGAVLSLRTHRRAGLTLSLIGCAILTVMVGNIDTRGAHGAELLWYSWVWVLIGPLLLITAAVLSLGTHRRACLTLSLIGCAILTFKVGYMIWAYLNSWRGVS